jgi:hypothetical protein
MYSINLSNIMQSQSDLDVQDRVTPQLPLVLGQYIALRRLDSGLCQVR